MFLAIFKLNFNLVVLQMGNDTDAAIGPSFGRIISAHHDLGTHFQGQTFLYRIFFLVEFLFNQCLVGKCWRIEFVKFLFVEFICFCIY